MKKIITSVVLVLSSLAAANAQNTIRGMVSPVSPQSSTADMMVWLIEKCPSAGSYTLTAIDSQLVIDSMHLYYFQAPTVGSGCQLLVKAAFLPSSVHYSSYLPTYYGVSAGSLSWSGATPVTAGPTYHDFTMISGTNPGGPGFIGGSVLLGANKGTAVGDPLEGRTMILTDMSDKAVAYTKTDATGAFSFPSVANGTYKLFGDQWGKDNKVLYVTVDAANQNIKNIVFEENDTKFSGRYVWATNVTNVNSNLSEVSVYPNPVQGQINVSGLSNIKGAKSVTLTSVTGAVIFTQRYNEGQAVVISANDMASGLYMLEVATIEGNKTFKLMK